MDKDTLSLISNTYGIDPNSLTGATTGGGFNPWIILLGILFGIIGFYAFNTGRKEKNWRWLILGIALMVFPYFIANIWLVLLIGILLTAAIFLWKD